ncbi:MAG: recombinase family protein [Terrisporobacter sp.]|uniref:recombinase family protein n=1 Tax=Terrisporobacter sp. TaxID=1965305 RepID=UPI00399BB20E
MEQLIVKYHRVSSIGQSLERQRIATDEYITTKYPNAICKTYEDEQSGKNFNRKNYLEMKQFILEYKAINPNTEIIIVVKELDRFGRNMQMIKEEWDYWKKVKVYINVVDTEILNTNGKSDLETELIGNIVLDLLSYFAENERLKNNRRQREGYDALEKNEEGKLIGKNGEVVGRKKTTIDTIPTEFKKEYEKFKNGDYGKMTNLKFAEMMGIKKTTFYKYAKILEGK